MTLFNKNPENKLKSTHDLSLFQAQNQKIEITVNKQKVAQRL